MATSRAKIVGGKSISAFADRSRAGNEIPEPSSDWENAVQTGKVGDMNDLSRIFKALADPIRLRILLLLASEGELCVCDLMAVMDLPQSTVSRHLAYLKRACWLDGRRQGVWMYYRIRVESCSLCVDLLAILQQHAMDREEATADRASLAAFMKDKPDSCS
jgi:ArsR family transcriptional regulator